MVLFKKKTLKKHLFLSFYSMARDLFLKPARLWPMTTQPASLAFTYLHSETPIWRKYFFEATSQGVVRRITSCKILDGKTDEKARSSLLSGCNVCELVQIVFPLDWGDPILRVFHDPEHFVDNTWNVL